MTVLWILIGLFAAVALLLALPLRVSLRYHPQDGFSYRVKYLCFTLADSTDIAENAAPAEKKPPKSDRRAVKKLLSFLGLEELADLKNAVREQGVAQVLCNVCAAVRRLLSDTFSLVRKGTFRHFDLRITVGDADPADAALNYGTVCSAVYPLVTLFSLSMRLKHPKTDIRCDYAQEDTTVFFDGQVNYRPWHFVCFLCRLFANYLKKERNQA